MERHGVLGGWAFGGRAGGFCGGQVGKERVLEEGEGVLRGFRAEIDDFGVVWVEGSVSGVEEPFDGTREACGNLHGACGKLLQQRVFSCGKFAEVCDCLEFSVGAAKGTEHGFFGRFGNDLSVLTVAVEDFLLRGGGCHSEGWIEGEVRSSRGGVFVLFFVLDFAFHFAAEEWS
jgi:hypothetical protein